MIHCAINDIHSKFTVIDCAMISSNDQAQFMACKREANEPKANERFSMVTKYRKTGVFRLNISEFAMPHPGILPNANVPPAIGILAAMHRGT
ncbi:hypothetical protein Ddc_06503 [Ditylenchus destructor]|nr:hypothetical protein Ddc_06503 [Ditylenchus destructor]